MGINIGVCELEAENSRCRKYKTTVIKALVKDLSGLEDIAETDEYVTLDDAKKLFGDWEAFIKRNRINEEADAVYIVKVKNDDDLALLKPFIKTKYTGWIDLKDLSEEKKQIVLDRSDREDRITEWDQLDFDQMNEACANCPLSWDKGRGCIGAFGPSNSLLPEIAKKRDCPIVASAPENAKSQKRFTPEDAKELKREVEVLTAALPEEGKVYVRRYAGPLERMNAVADVSIKENCGFYFF